MYLCNTYVSCMYVLHVSMYNVYRIIKHNCVTASVLADNSRRQVFIRRTPKYLCSCGVHALCVHKMPIQSQNHSTERTMLYTLYFIYVYIIHEW